VHDEQTFGEPVDIEHMFVLQWKGSEQVFEGGKAMSVAFDVEYDTLYPRLRVVSEKPGRAERMAAVRRRRVVLAGTTVVALLVLLLLPIRALGGTTVTASPGREYVVRSGDTLGSIAARMGGRNVASMERRLADEAGSTVLVPGEHLLIP
jgi:LysM domain